MTNVAREARSRVRHHGGQEFEGLREICVIGLCMANY